jgi:membrane protein YqaA with SNARE-associated domain
MLRSVHCPPSITVMTTETKKTSNLGRLLTLLFAVGLSLGIIWLTNRYQQEIQSWGEAGLLGLFIVSIIGNATLIIPAPVFVVACAAGMVYGPLQVGVVAAAGAAIGELTGYLAGYGGQAIVPQGRFYNWLRGFMQQRGVLAIFLLGAIPNPIFDVGGLIAGAMKMPVWKFLLAAWAGKTIRLGLTAWACLAGIPWLQQIFR